MPYPDPIPYLKSHRHCCISPTPPPLLRVHPPPPASSHHLTPPPPHPCAPVPRPTTSRRSPAPMHSLPTASTSPPTTPMRRPSMLVFNLPPACGVWAVTRHQCHTVHTRRHFIPHSTNTTPTLWHFLTKKQLPLPKKEACPSRGGDSQV